MNKNVDKAVGTGTTSSLSAPQQQDWRSTIVGMTYLTRALSADLEAATGISMAEYELLLRLGESSDRRLRMSDLAQQVGHSRSRVTHTVARLERAGLVERLPANEDGRGIVAELTDAGYARLEAAAPWHEASVRERLIDIVTPEQLSTLAEAMRTALARTGIEAGLGPVGNRGASSVTAKGSVASD